MPGAPLAIGPLKLEHGRLAHHGLERQAGTGADTINLAPQGLVGKHGLGQANLLHHEGAGRQTRFDLQEAGALRIVQRGLQLGQRVLAQAIPVRHALRKAAPHVRTRLHQSTLYIFCVARCYRAAPGKPLAHKGADVSSCKPRV
jgi:streptomycin 6-kinase